MRHGATAGNEARRYVGCRTDEPLSELGITQCHRAGQLDFVERVYASPLLRAQQTAAICFPRARVVTIDGLQEFDFGDFEGRTPDEMEDDAAYRAWVEGNCEGRCPGGDSLDGFVSRTWHALNQILHGAVDREEDLVAVVAHGGTIMAALDGFYDKGVGNCEGYVADVREVDGSFEFKNPKHFARLTDVTS